MKLYIFEMFIEHNSVNTEQNAVGWNIGNTSSIYSGVGRQTAV
jgi:hypothetical protein